MVSLSRFLPLSLTLPVDALHQPSPLDLSDPPLPSAWLQNKPSPFSLFPISRSPKSLVIPAPLHAVPGGGPGFTLSPRRAKRWHKHVLTSFQSSSHQHQAVVLGRPGLSPSAMGLQGWSTRARGGWPLRGLKDSVALPCLRVQLCPTQDTPWESRGTTSYHEEQTNVLQQFSSYSLVVHVTSFHFARSRV